MTAGTHQPVFDERERLPLPQVLAEDRRALAAQLRSVLARSRFYAEKWTAEQRDLVASVRPQDVEAVLAGLPLTMKDELRVAQELAPPFGTHLAVDEAEVSLVHRTSGTTGRPLVIAATEEDMRQTFAHGAQAFWCAGLRETDTVVHCLNYCMWAGGYTDHRCLERAGAAVVPFGVGNTDELVSLQEWLPFSAISCTPSYISLLMERLDETSRALWAKHLRLVLVGGEPGGSEAALRERVHDSFGARIVNANYGLAEVLSNFASECEQGDGMHFHGHGAIWIELLDESTGATLPLRTGSQGTLLLTHVDRRAQPLVRYNTHDTLEVLSTEPCACGRSTFRFHLRGRADDMFVVRGINVFPDSIRKALAEHEPSLDEFAVLLPDTPTFDAIPLAVERPAAGVEVDVERIRSSIKRWSGSSAIVRVVEPRTLPRSHGKTRRVYRRGERPAGLETLQMGEAHE